MCSSIPDITILTPSRNHARALEETILSVQSQSFKNWEHIIIDAASTDGTIEILTKYPHLRYVSEPDKGFSDAINKGLRLARGKYVTTLLVWDVMHDANWLKDCFDLFESNPEIALVHARAMAQHPDGEWAPPYPPEPFVESAPQLSTLFYYYLLSPFFHFVDLAFMARRETWLSCYPNTVLEVDNIDCGLTFNYNFHKSGYLAYFLPRVVVHGRTHSDSRIASETDSGIIQKNLAIFRDQRRKLRKQLLSRRIHHTFRMGNGSPHPSLRFDYIGLLLALCIYKLLRLIRNKWLHIDASYRNPAEIQYELSISLKIAGLWK